MLLQTIIKRAEKYSAAFPGIPADLDSIAASQNLKIRYEELPSEVSGFITIKDANIFIVVNSEHPEVRKRFTLAHEIGHFCLGHMETEAIFIDQNAEQFKLYRTGTHHSVQKELEREANIFAANLLMPASALKDHIESSEFDNFTVNYVIERLAQKFAVSAEAMRYRLINLKLIDETMLYSAC